MTTPKQTAFADAYVENGANGAAAYRAAYDASDMSPGAIWTEASLLLKHPEVAQRIRDAMTVTAESVTLELAENRRVALSPGDGLAPQVAAANRATELKGKLKGVDAFVSEASSTNVQVNIIDGRDDRLREFSIEQLRAAKALPEAPDTVTDAGASDE